MSKPIKQSEMQGEIDRLSERLADTYTLVPWPESQDYMDLAWFEDEAILNPNESAAYFIPTKYIT